MAAATLASMANTVLRNVGIVKWVIVTKLMELVHLAKVDTLETCAINPVLVNALIRVVINRVQFVSLAALKVSFLITAMNLAQ